jgi:hypothetical protein
VQPTSFALNTKEAYLAMSSTLEPIRIASDQPGVSGAVPQELHQVLLSAGFRGRQVTALSARLGLAGQGAVTLAEAGRTAGYTRERVRQLEGRLREHAAGGEHSFAAVRGALRRVERIAPAPSTEVASVLAGAGLVPHSFQMSGLLRTADVLGLEHDLCEVDAAMFRARDLDLVEETMTLARRLVRRDGVGNVARLAYELARDPAAVRRLLALNVDVSWLDRQRSWFLVAGTPSRAGNVLRKMLSVCCPLTLGEVREGLRRAPRPVIAPDEVIASLCEAVPWLVVDRARDIVTLKVALDVHSTHSAIELAILRIFAEHGPRLTFSEVVEEGERRGLKRMSVGAYLTRMPALERLGRGVYAVRVNEAA